jgi:hypothetical protein
MNACASTVDQSFVPIHAARVLRWTFRRADETAVCELGLNSDELAYELRLTVPGDAHRSVEVFSDAIAAFHRQTAVERTLVAQGWSLEGFHSDRGAD